MKNPVKLFFNWLNKTFGEENGRDEVKLVPWPNGAKQVVIQINQEVVLISTGASRFETIKNRSVEYTLIRKGGMYHVQGTQGFRPEEFWMNQVVYGIVKVIRFEESQD